MHGLKDIREREHEQQGLIRALCRRLGNVQPDGLLEAVDDLPSQKKVDELKAKNAFLLKKSSKTGAELKEEKEEHKKGLNKLNVALAFNQKLEAYVGNTGDVINKVKLFDANLAKNSVTTGKVIPVLVDFAEKMEELLDKMRVLFDGLQPKVPPIAAENLPDISGEISSLTGWGKEATTETPTEPDQPGASEPTQEEEVPARPEPPHSPRTRTVGTSPAPTEVLVNTVVDELVRELEEEERHAFETSTPVPPAWIDTVQTGPEEPMAERMRELPTRATPPSSPTPKPISVATPRPLVRPTFLSQLEKITQTPFRMPGPILTFQLPVSTPTPVSIGTDTQGKPEASGSVRSANKETEATSLAPRVTRSATKQTPATSSLPKRPYLSSSKGSSSKKQRR